MTRGRPKNPPRTNFERRLRKMMTRAGVKSYAELARKIDVPPATIQRICSGARQPSIGTLRAIADALGCKVDDLLV